VVDLRYVSTNGSVQNAKNAKAQGFVLTEKTNALAKSVAASIFACMDV
jgi:hypothetical protein